MQTKLYDVENKPIVGDGKAVIQIPPESNLIGDYVESVFGESGRKSTEFILTVIVMILGAIASFGFFPQESSANKIIAVVLVVMSSLGYTAARTMIKSRKLKLESSVANVKGEGVKFNAESGKKTTEFVLTLVAVVLSSIMSSGYLIPDSQEAKIIGLVLLVLSSLGYSASRAKIKVDKINAQNTPQL